MLYYTLTEAKAKFHEVIAKAAAGEEIILTRRGNPILCVEGIKPPLINDSKPKTQK